MVQVMIGIKQSIINIYYRLLGSSKGDGNNTLFVEWINESSFMTGGVKHGNFWNATSVTKKRALFKNAPITTLVCAATLNNCINMNIL